MVNLSEVISKKELKKKKTLRRSQTKRKKVFHKEDSSIGDQTYSIITSVEESVKSKSPKHKINKSIDSTTKLPDEPAFKNFKLKSFMVRDSSSDQSRQSRKGEAFKSFKNLNHLDSLHKVSESQGSMIHIKESNSVDNLPVINGVRKTGLTNLNTNNHSFDSLLESNIDQSQMPLSQLPTIKQA